MKILQKDGKCTIESESAAKVSESYTTKQLVEDLITKTKSGEIEWEKNTESSYLYHTIVGGKVVTIWNYQPGYELWLGFTGRYCGRKDSYKHCLGLGFWLGRKLFKLICNIESRKMAAGQKQEMDDLQREILSIKNSLG